MNRWLLWLLMLISPWASALGEELWLAPDTCAMTNQESECKLQLQLEFHSQQPRSLCLWLAHSAAPLTCFHQRRDFSYKLQLSLARDTLIELRDQQNRTIASRLLRVAIYEPASRRRRGLSWDLL